MTIEERRMSSPDDVTQDPVTEAVNDVLRQWRAAERRLAELPPGSDAWARTVREIDLLRDRYHEAFRSVAPPEDDPEQISA